MKAPNPQVPATTPQAMKAPSTQYLSVVATPYISAQLQSDQELILVPRKDFNQYEVSTLPKPLPTHVLNHLLSRASKLHQWAMKTAE